MTGAPSRLHTYSAGSLVVAYFPQDAVSSSSLYVVKRITQERKKSVDDHAGTSVGVYSPVRIHLALDDLHRILRQRTDLSNRELKVPDTISKLDAV